MQYVPESGNDSNQNGFNGTKFPALQNHIPDDTDENATNADTSEEGDMEDSGREQEHEEGDDNSKD